MVVGAGSALVAVVERFKKSQVDKKKVTIVERWRFDCDDIWRRNGTAVDHIQITPLRYRIMASPSQPFLSVRRGR